jgi:hypothetical protein
MYVCLSVCAIVPLCTPKKHFVTHYYNPYKLNFLLIFEMRKKFFAIIGALIAGGLGIALISSTQAAHAALTQN